MRIAIASSGLGHVHRGMEAWAEDLAQSLFERDVDVILFRGSGSKKKEYEVILPTLKRDRWPAIIVAKLTSKGGWRIGLGAPHAVESFIFGMRLLRYLRHSYDLVHIQQGSLAMFLSRAKKLGLLDIPIILANGQIASDKFLSHFKYVQDLSPFKEGIVEYDNTGNESKRFIIPNFVDTNKYSPQNKKRARKKLGLPENAFVVSTVGAINKHHKRMDYFVKEMARLGENAHHPYHFLIVGATDIDTEEITNLARLKLDGKVTILLNFPRNNMPDIFNASDVFVLCSLKEAFGIVLIEAMACGVPVMCHKYPVLEWVVREGGVCIDMSINGNLAKILTDYFENEKLRKTKGNSGRNRVFQEFSEDAVVTKTIAMYRSVISDSQK